ASLSHISVTTSRLVKEPQGIGFHLGTVLPCPCSSFVLFSCTERVILKQFLDACCCKTALLGRGALTWNPSLPTVPLHGSHVGILLKLKGRSVAARSALQRYRRRLPTQRRGVTWRTELAVFTIARIPSRTGTSTSPTLSARAPGTRPPRASGSSRGPR